MNNPQSYPQPYGQQPFGQQQTGQMGIETLNMSDALSIAWNHFTRQWVPWVLSSVIVAIAFGVPFVIMYLSLVGWIISMEESATSSSYSSYDSYDSYNSYNSTTTEPAFNPFALGGISIAFMLIIVVGIVLSVIFTLNCYRNALRMTQGEVIKTTDFFRISGLGKPFLVQIVMGIAILPVGLLTFGLGAIVLAVMWMYVTVAAFANPNASIGEIFGDGFRAFKNNMGQSILLLLVLVLINAVISWTGRAMLVTVPLQYITLAVAYCMCKQMPIVLPQGVTTSQDTHAGGYGPGAPGSQAPGTQPWYDPTGGSQGGYSQPGYGQPDYDQTGYGQTGYPQPGSANPGYYQPGGNAQQGGQQPPNQGYGYGGQQGGNQQGGNDQGGGQPGTGWQPWNQQ